MFMHFIDQGISKNMIMKFIDEHTISGQRAFQLIQMSFGNISWTV